MATEPQAGEVKSHQRKRAVSVAGAALDTLVVDLSSLRAEAMTVLDEGAIERPRGNAARLKIGDRVLVKAAGRPSGKGMATIDLDERTSVKDLLTQTLASIAEVREQATEPMSSPELQRRVGTALVEKAEEQAASSLDASVGWQQLLERGLQFKTRLLGSDEFRTTAAASQLSGVGEAAIRKRIRAGKLFALAVPGTDEHRIPVWALDPAVSGTLTASLLQAAEGMDAWALYHFMTTPHGRLRGLRPFEALIGLDLLAPSQRASRMALAAAAGLPSGRPLADPVLAALRAEVAEHPAA